MRGVKTGNRRNRSPPRYGMLSVQVDQESEIDRKMEELVPVPPQGDPSQTEKSPLRVRIKEPSANFSVAGDGVALDTCHEENEAERRANQDDIPEQIPADEEKPTLPPTFELSGQRSGLGTAQSVKHEELPKEQGGKQQRFQQNVQARAHVRVRIQDLSATRQPKNDDNGEPDGAQSWAWWQDPAKDATKNAENYDEDETYRPERRPKIVDDERSLDAMERTAAQITQVGIHSPLTATCCVQHEDAVLDTARRYSIELSI
eukprot:1897000-Rhodomonas_salina.1